MTTFNEAMCHTLIAKGGVALPPSPDPYKSWQYERFGSYYGSTIEASLDDTLALLERIHNGARPVYEKCGPSNFGQENRFNGTFTDIELIVYYVLFPVVFDDDLEHPVELIANVEQMDWSHSFIKTLENLFTGITFDEAVAQMKDRITAPEGKKYYYNHHHATGKKTFSPTFF